MIDAREGFLIEEKVAERGLKLEKVVQSDGMVLVLPKIEVGRREQLFLVEEDKKYFQDALSKMPYLLAVHATFNMAERPDLSLISTGVIPMVGVEAPPRTGKTSMLLLTKLENPEAIKVWDFDVFSTQSYDRLENQFELLTRQIDLGSASEVYKVLQKVVLGAEKRNEEKLTLKEKLDKAAEEYLGIKKQRKPVMAILVDLPGRNSGRTLNDEYDELKESLPLIKLRNGEPLGLLDEDNMWGMADFYEMYRQVKEALGANYRPHPDDRQNWLLPIEWARVNQQVAKECVS